METGPILPASAPGPHTAHRTGRARPQAEAVPEQWYVLVTCRDEKEQVALLERLGAEGLECRALLS